MDLFNGKTENYTERAQKVLDLSAQEAERFYQQIVGTEHLLLGLIRERDGVAARILLNFGLQLPKVRSAVEFIMGYGNHVGCPSRVTTRFETVLRFAREEAERLGHHYVGTEHLLLGLIHVNSGIGFGLIESLGVHPAQITERIENVIRQSTAYQEDTFTQPPSKEAEGR